MRRRLWFDWHSWVGLNLSVLLAFVLLTGTLATLSPELDWLANPAKRAVSTGDAIASPATFLQNFHAAYPNAEAERMELPEESWLAPELIAVHADGERFRVFFSRTSGAIQGTGRWFNWQRFLRESHRHLMLPLNIGLTIVSLLSIPLLVAFVSSLNIYRRWWRGFFRWPGYLLFSGHSTHSQTRTKRRLWGGLHRLAGVWSLWFVLLMAVTGIWYLVEHLGLNASLPPLSATPQSNNSNPRLLKAAPERLDGMMQVAAQQHPHLQVRTIVLNAYGGAVVLQGQATTALVRNRANHVAFDARNGDVVDVRRGEQLSLHNRISEAADPLHFGYFGGPATRVLWAVFGILSTGLALSGVYLFGLRSLTAIRSSDPKSAGGWSNACSRLRARYYWPQLLLVGLCLSLALVQI